MVRPDMRVMSESPRSDARSRGHLRLVVDGPVDVTAPPAARPRTIGRVIAQTALIADSAVTRRRMDSSLPEPGRGMAGRLLGRFR